MAKTHCFRKRAGAWLGVIVALFAPSGGCAPQLDAQQYGKVVPSVPKVEGADKPYPLPELEETPGLPTGEAKQAEK